MPEACGEDICFTMSVVDEFRLAAACHRHLRHAYPDALLLLLADAEAAAVERWRELAVDSKTHVIAAPRRLYAVEQAGRVVSAHLAAFLETRASWWFKIDPDTFVRRPLTTAPAPGCFFGTIQTRDPRPVLQGGCIGGDRESVARLAGGGALRSAELFRFEESWAARNPIVLRRARAGLVSFDFIHAWACEAAGIAIASHPEIKSYWLGPPRRATQYAITHPHKNLDALDPADPDEPSPVAEAMRGLMAGTVPEDAVVAVVSRGDDALLELDGRDARHFPQHECGTYIGYHPTDAHEALDHLRAATQRGVRFLVIPEPSLWWLEYYEEFGRTLNRDGRRVAAGEGGVVYDLGAVGL
jgi:hypothetical protein